MNYKSSLPLVGIALDTPIRSRRNRIPDLQTIKAKIKRVVERATEAMVKVTGSARSAAHLKSHFDYISRNSKIEVETERGEVITTKERLREEHGAWSDELGVPRKNERHTINIVLSMPEGTDAEAVRRASRAFAQSLFAATHQYLMAVHHPGNDPDSKHPHAHLTVKARGYDGSRLDPKKVDLQAWREVFAAKMREQGYEVEATPRRARGVVMKSSRGVVRAIDSDEKRPARGTVRKAKLLEAAEELAGRSTSENPYREQIVETQRVVRAGWLQGAAELEKSQDPNDHTLAKKIRDFVRELPRDLIDERSQLQTQLIRELEAQRARVDLGAVAKPHERGDEGHAPER